MVTLVNRSSPLRSNTGCLKEKGIPTTMSILSQIKYWKTAMLCNTLIYTTCIASSYFSTLIRKRRSPGSPSMWGSPDAAYTTLATGKINKNKQKEWFAFSFRQVTFSNKRVLHFISYSLFNFYLQGPLFINQPRIKNNKNQISIHFYQSPPYKAILPVWFCK